MLSLFNSLEKRGGYWNAVTIIIIRVVHLDGDNLALDSLRNVFTRKAAQVC